jgi:hypothetical protein
MPSEVNKYGLSRDISDPIKRQVRQECGFGCVCCGLAIMQYEHIDPEFHEAKEHDPDKIACLCGACHDRVTRRYWSKEKIKAARKNPYNVKRGKCHDAFDIGSPDPIVIIGNNLLRHVPSSLVVDGEPLLMIEAPEKPGGPYQLSGKFYGDDGRLLFEIVRNEWFGELSSWDVEAVGGRVTIRTGPGKIALQLLCVPPRGIGIEVLNIRRGVAHITADKTCLKVVQAGASGLTRLSGVTIDGDEGADISIQIKDGCFNIMGKNAPFRIRVG